MAQSKKSTRKVKTYFLQFDGDLLFHNGCRPFTIEHVFETGGKQKIFHQLFDNEDGWDILRDMFYMLFDMADDGGNILGYNIPDQTDEKHDEFDHFAAFVKYYVVKGADQFFNDVDKTWVTRDITAYAFIRSDEMEKLLTVMKICASDEAISDNNTENLDPDEYYKRPTSHKRTRNVMRE